MDDRYEQVTLRGYTLNRWTVAALLAAEQQYGAEFELYQGSYHAGVDQSAGTHDGGGAIDVGATNWDRAVLALRLCGFAAWHRTPEQGPWGHHIHAVLIGDTDAAPSALRQVQAYRDGHNGLADNGPDDGPRVAIREFPYGEDWFEMATRDDVKAAVREVLAEFFRDDDGGAPDIGRARVKSRDGKTVMTLADLLYSAAKKG